jgi:hypothetical protein
MIFELQCGEGVAIMRIAGAMVLVVTAFVSFYVPLESLAMQRRMKIREMRRRNSLWSPRFGHSLIHRYSAKAGVASNLGGLGLKPECPIDFKFG